MNIKSKKLEELYKVCLREFPEYSHEIVQIINIKEFIEMIEEYSMCERKLMELKDRSKIREGYEQLLKEIKEEIYLYILKHLQKNVSN